MSNTGKAADKRRFLLLFPAMSFPQSGASVTGVSGITRF
ncbi:UNVERIFIED_ORG: hypothetical protein ABIC62_004396 [Burkholderia sp. 1595]|uniref:Uncharacterized protein n=1 Tax=Paraburkholderia terricola TaxID=169427 RepID=A0ABU1LWU9_9BURK|nr:hypothetical protein [Paraburkholderia terricola]MDR6483263.1 hypothetical protein [Paraburkholderia terricola]